MLIFLQGLLEPGLVLAILFGTVTHILGLVKTEFITQVLNDDIQGRDCVVYIGFLDSYGQLVDDPIVLFKGLMDVLSIYESGNSTYVSIDAESLLRDFEGTRTRRLTDQDQKSEYPGDRGLEYVAGLQEAEIFWGREYEK